jgi:AraC-like DNA-binding protein
MLAAEGLNARHLLAGAAISPAVLDSPGARLATEKVSHLWEIAAQQSFNPAIGLAQHHVARPASFDVVGYAMMACADLRAALNCLERHLLILSDGMTMHLEEEPRGYRISFLLFGGDRPVPRQRVEFIMATVICFLRWMSGRELYPASIELPYPSPADLAPYRETFRCQVAFCAERNSVLFSHADMDAPLRTSNPILAQTLDRIACEHLRRISPSHTSYQAREIIIRRLPHGEPRRDQVARDLHMSQRTLRRRLEEEATSFAELLDGARRDLAAQYLVRLDLSFAEMAFRLGFEDQRSFFRACRRWFQLSPTQYRTHLLTRPADLVQAKAPDARLQSPPPSRMRPRPRKA